MHIDKALDKYQRPFAQDPLRALRLLAPAGSGKTHSLLWRCLYQWKKAKATKPRFLIFTFTKAARDELVDRLRNVSDFAEMRGSVEVATLNSWGFRRLKSRMHSVRLLVSSNDLFFAVHNNLQPVWTKHERLRDLMTQTKSRSRAAKAVIHVMDGLKSLGFRHDVHYKAKEFDLHVSWLRDIGLVTYLTNIIQDLSDLQIIRPEVSKLGKEMEKGFLPFWKEATESLRQMAMITLEDQKYWAWLDVEEAVAAGSFTTGMHRVGHILVDEFQDVNCLDLRLLQSIAKLNKAELTLIGDDDQSIYEWRGASPRFILQPDEYVGSGYKTHILSRNYRSPRNVVALSQQLIKHNKRRVEKEIQAVSDRDAQIDVLGFNDVASTVDYVSREVESMLAERKIESVAIVGRKRGQIIPYQIVFAGRGIPFYAAEDLQLFLSVAFGELQDILGIKARAAVGPIPGLDPVQDLLKLVDKVKRYPLSKPDRTALLKYLRTVRHRNLASCLSVFRRYTGPLKGSNDDAGRSNSFADSIQALLDAESVSDSVQAISEHFQGLQKDYGKSMEDIFYTDPPFLHLAEFARRYKSDYGAFYEDLDKAISTLARVPDSEHEEQGDGAAEWKRPLHLMTALRTKGKEFDAVIILDVNQDIWPSKLADTPEQLEQERRVFYVAFTRARKRLMLLVNDSMLGRPALPSPYLGEMGLSVTKIP